MNFLFISRWQWEPSLYIYVKQTCPPLAGPPNKEKIFQFFRKWVDWAKWNEKYEEDVGERDVGPFLCFSINLAFLLNRLPCQGHGGIKKSRQNKCPIICFALRDLAFTFSKLPTWRLAVGLSCIGFWFLLFKIIFLELSVVVRWIIHFRRR